MAKNVIGKALDRDFVRVGRSRIEGRGVFAKRRIPRGARIIEYKGKRRAVANLFAAVAEGKAAPVYTFALSDGLVIDGSVHGNESRLINHSCEPNCEAYAFESRVYIYASREIVRGEELTFDYKLGNAADCPPQISDETNYACRCGAKNCRGTMLAQEKTEARGEKNKCGGICFTLSRHPLQMAL